MFAVRGKDGHAYLFNGPQLGFSTPELFVEVEVHWPGNDIRGVTAPGVPVIGIGHNGSVAWGFTSGLSDEDDLYAEQLVPGKPETYIYKGAGAADGVPRRDLHLRQDRLGRAGDRGAASWARRPSGSAARSTARCSSATATSRTPVATRSGSGTSRRSRGSPR